VLVGHSYGGAVITNAAVGVPHVKALVYIAGFAPDTGESLVQLVTMNPGSEIGQKVITRKYPLPSGGEGNGPVPHGARVRDRVCERPPQACR
jgi:pimeloyl-ACP methyl ester carboxylesterase